MTSGLKYVLTTTIILPPLALTTMLWSKDMTKTAREWPIFNGIFKSWIQQMHGAPKNLFVGNGWEFANSKFIDMAE